MAVSIAAVMRFVNNYFERSCTVGTFTVSGGVLSPAISAPYVAIDGSAYHGGVYRPDQLREQPEETFTGRVWALYPPDDFLQLCEQINAYDEQNPAGALQSEQFGEYSYTRMGGESGPPSWQKAFASQLWPYRRMFTEVSV